MNIYDVAKEAGVSPATVSRVLNGNLQVKDATREKVLQVIKGTNYIPNMFARNLSIGESQTIAFVVPDIENPFFNKILHGITDKAMAYDYNVSMFGTDENTEREHKILASLKAEMIKGIIIIPVSEADGKTKAKLQRFVERGIPVVLLDRDINGGDFDGVFSQDDTGVFQAMECFFEAGHRRIAIITGPETSRPGYERLKGYKNALKKHGIPIEPRYIMDGRFREEESYHAMKALMALNQPPTAVLTSNNMTTLGCLRHLKESRMRLGQDISLIGFDDIPELKYTDTNLTVITRPVYEMGCEAMGLLESRFQNCEKPSATKVVRRNILKTFLIRRGSEKLVQPNKEEGNTMKKVTVFGSFVVDLMARTPHLPVPGETVKGSIFKMGPGGKGFNQCVAAHKAGANVQMVTKLGRDAFSNVALDSMDEMGMPKDHIFFSDDKETGIALIWVDEKTSQNEIIVVAGACDTINDAEIARIEPLIKDSAYVLLQLEVNQDANEKVADMANRYGCKVILNSAPYAPLTDEFLSKVYMITPNEVEAEELTGIPVTDLESAKKAAKYFYKRGVQQVIITLGERGVFVSSDGHEEIIPAFKVNALDTTGAGDAFNGGLLAALSEGQSIAQAVRFANALAAISVQRLGTTPSMPSRQEILDLL